MILLFAAVGKGTDDASARRDLARADAVAQQRPPKGDVLAASLSCHAAGAPGLVSAWTDSQNDSESYQHGTIRARARIISAGASACIVLRSDLDFYCDVFVLSDTGNAGIAYVTIPNEGFVELGRFPVAGGVTPGVAYGLEASAIGPNLTFKAWRDGDADGFLDFFDDDAFVTAVEVGC